MKRVVRWLVRRLAKLLGGSGLWLGGAVALPAVVAGYLGYRQLTPDASQLDSLYSALQLLAANGSSTPDGLTTPWLLTTGRLLGLVVTFSAVAFVLIRMGASTVSLAAAAVVSGHRLVIGSGDTARAIVTAPSRFEVTVIAGDFEPRAATELRRAPAIVVNTGSREVPAAMIRGSSEIIVAEDKDLDALSRLDELRAWDAERSPGHRLRVVVNSAAIARDLRQRLLLRNDFTTSVASVSEAIARRLLRLHPPAADGRRRDLIVIGAGHLPLDVVVTAVNEHALDGHTWTIKALGPRGEAWLDAVPRRATHSHTSIEVHHVVLDPILIAQDLGALCRRPDDGERTASSPLVLIVGLPDGDAIATRREIGRQLGNTPTVVVLADAQRRTTDGTDPGQEMRTRELLTDRDALEASPAELLADHFRRHLQLHDATTTDATTTDATLPPTGSGRLIRAMAHRHTRPPEDGLEQLAVEVLSRFADAGGQFRTLAIVPAHAGATLGPVRARMVARLSSTYADVLSPIGEIPRSSVASFVSDVIRMMARIGIEINDGDLGGSG